MKNKILDIANNVFVGVFIVLFLWIFITTTIQRFENDTLTETQLFENIPNSMILKFK